MLSLSGLIFHLLLWANAHAYLPLWKNLLTHHLDWAGSYSYRGEEEAVYDCSLTVSSISLSDNGVSYVALTAEHIQMDMTITTDDDVVLSLKEEAVWNKTEIFHHHTQIGILGKFVSDHLYYVFTGNISSAEEENFAVMVMRPKGFLVRTHRPRDHSSLKYGLAVGIPLVCAALLMVAGAMIMWWAIKRGYLRHVPGTYVTFRNPDRPRSVLELSDSGGGGGGGESPSIHI